MRQITIRNVPDELAAALAKEKKRRGTSLNQTALDLLRQALGVGRSSYDNGLSRLSGGWTRKQVAEFQAHTESFEQIDPELWQ